MSTDGLDFSSLAIAAESRRNSSGGRFSGCESGSSFALFLSCFRGDDFFLMYALGSSREAGEAGALDVSKVRKFSAVRGALAFGDVDLGFGVELALEYACRTRYDKCSCSILLSWLCLPSKAVELFSSFARFRPLA